MASTSGIKEDQPNNDQELLSMIKEITDHNEYIETSIKNLQTLRDQEEEIRKTRKRTTEIDENIITDINQLYADHQPLKNTFQRLCSDHFIVSDEGVCLELKQDIENDEKLVLGLKIRIQILRDREEHLRGKLVLLLAEIYKYNFGDDDITIPLEPEESETDLSLRTLFLASRQPHKKIQCWDPRLLNKKIRIIRYYYLRQHDLGKRFSSSSSINSGLQNKFAWLRSTKIEVDLDGDRADMADIITPNIDELRWNIRRLVKDRRNQKRRAREEAKKSLLEYVIRDGDAGEFTTLNLMHKKARELGDLLSRHVSDVFYMTLETGESFHKFKDHLRLVLGWLDEKEKTPVIKRVLEVLQDVEEDLYLLGKFQFYPPYSDVPLNASTKQQDTMDRIVHTLLREILRLESIISYPSLSDEFLSTASVEIKTLKKSLDECETVVAEIGEEMRTLKAMHVFVAEDDKEGSIVKSFENGRASVVTKAWTDLREDYVPY